MKVAVYAKVMMRKEGLEFTLNHLDFWIKTFENSGFDFFIYNENLNLSNYNNVITKNELLQNISLQKIKNHIDNKSNIDQKWKGAAFALTSPYFYLEGYDYIINLDADDIKLKNKAFYYIQKALNFMETNKIPILSYDIYNSLHNHWSFGISLAKLDVMKDYITKTLYRNVHRPKWGINIDHMMDMYLKNTNHKYISFICPTLMEHGGSKGYCVNYNETSKKVEVNYYNKRRDQKDLHPRCIVI
jgi:hypothetical protein